MSAIWVFDYTESKHTLYRGKDCMKKFCEALREHTKIYIFFFQKSKKMLSLTREELKPHQNARNSYICGRRILKKNFLKV